MTLLEIKEAEAFDAAFLDFPVFRVEYATNYTDHDKLGVAVRFKHNGEMHRMAVLCNGYHQIDDAFSQLRAWANTKLNHITPAV